MPKKKKRVSVRSGGRLRAPVMWYGGKGNMLKKILPLLSRMQGDVYVEPYFGAGSVFWSARPRPVEVVNDLDGDVVNLMRALQDPERQEKLNFRLQSTPYSLDEFRLALQTLADASSDKDDRAWAFFVAFNQAFSGKPTSEGRWSRAFTSSRGMAANASKWIARLNLTGHWHRRILRAQIDNRCAIEVIRYWDSKDTVFYIDPPYAKETRAVGSTDVYSHECSDEHHRKLVDVLLKIKGLAMLSGYATKMYDPLEKAGWRLVRWRTAKSSAVRGRRSGIRGRGSALAKVPCTECCWVKDS